MDKPRILSGEALVAKGITKIDASLPEVGLKDVTPNGSWLEQKQIQAALEARKYLIEVERVEKSGTLSHAEWRDDLMLAEVTQKVGGYWQYLGHNVGKTLYLRPEETLFLMEVNCLLLKHNEVTVSLQKAYSLLLRSSTTMIQYKVYASLSRLGYRVFRHTGPKVNDEKKSYCLKLSRLHEMKDVESPTVSMDNEYKNVVSPIANKNKSEYNTPTVSLENESMKLDSSIVTKLNKSVYIGSSIVATEKDFENTNSSVVNTDVIESENDNEPIANTVSNLKNINSSIVDTYYIETDTTTKNNTLEESKNNKSPNDCLPIESQENEVSQNNEQEEVKDNVTNENIGEISDIKDSIEMAEDAGNSPAKENESLNIMEVDETAEVISSDNKIETIQEVSSTTIENNENCENKIDSVENMEICTENQEATGSGIVLIEGVDRSKNIDKTVISVSGIVLIEGVDRSKNIEAKETESKITPDVRMDHVAECNDDTNKDSARETVSFSEVATGATVDSGTHNIEDTTKCLEDVPNSNDTSDSNNCTSTENKIHKDYDNKDNHSVYSYLSKIEKITKRQLKPSASESIQRHFENIPDFSKERVVSVNVPEQQFIPKNIFLNKTTYLLNLQNIKKRSIRSASSESPSYTSSDEVNGTNIRRIRSSSGTEFPQNPNFFPNVRYPRYNHYRPYGFWRPQNNLNFYQLMFFQTRFQFQQRPHPFLRSSCFNFNQNNPTMCNNARKRMRTGKSAHFQGIKNLAVRLKQSLISGNTDMRNLETLHGLLHSYNLRYKTRLRLTENFDVVNEENILETIDLDDDEESKSKKPRLEQEDGDKFEENLYRLRQLALRLRDLETKDKATASHRRAFSKAIKTFNKSYNADVYLDDDNYEVIDRRCITLDSSSESDCVVEEKPQVCSKKLRNPFNILKRRSERLQSLNNPGTSKDDNTSHTSKTEPGPAAAGEDINKYSELILKTFNETWLPNEKDFGRAEIVPKRYMNSRLVFSSKEQFLHEFMKDQFHQYHNWLEAKISFLRYLEDTDIAFKSEQARISADSELCNTVLKPLIDFEDSSDMPSVLEKLRIIKNNKEIDTETSLKIDFDVYNRDVQNFRKRNPPKPHFRIICIDESSGVPSTAHVMSLHSKYEDNVAIVFAIVGTGSISYLQMNPIDLPIYVPINDIV